MFILGIGDIAEVIVRTINCLCEDLHPGFFFLGRILVNENLYCAIDSIANAAISRVQYWLTYAYNLITTMLSLVVESILFDFSDFTTKLRTAITDVSPVLGVAPERLAMSAIFTGRYFNNVIKSLACTISTEIVLHQNDSTLVNGTVPLPHTALPPTGDDTFLNETLYFQCMKNDPTFELNIFGALAHVAAATTRAQFVVEKIFPAGLFRIAFEFFTLPSPISDDGSVGFDIGTPIPNDSNRFLMSVRSYLIYQIHNFMIS